MLQDIWTVMRKELTEIFQRTNRKGASKWSFIIYLAVFGVLLPISSGVGGVKSGSSALMLIWLPYLLIISVITDSFAGERERHTLETLLSTRLSDQAILYGKMGAALVYGAGLSLASFFLGIVVINIANGFTSFISYPGWVYGAVIFACIFVGLFAAAAGVIASLRAETARQAAQRVGLIFMIIFIPLYLIPLLPEFLLVDLASRINEIDPVPVIAGIAAALVALDVVLVIIARKRFQRSEMILD